MAIERSSGSARSRGTMDNPPCRFHAAWVEPVEDGWIPSGTGAAVPRTQLQEQRSRQVLTRNRSPDVPFEQSVNPYRGCEHGCIYCYARPNHAWMDLSPGLDFETRLFYKPDAPELLARVLDRPGYRPSPIALGTATDAWQPAERRLQLTRRIIQVLAERRHPLCAVTKSALVERDLDLLAPMAEQGLVRCALSITTLDAGLSRRMEPRAAVPARRLRVLSRLQAAGVPCGVLVAPVIPGLNDHELESILAAARRAGARFARMVVLRLPYEVEELFETWLDRHMPQRRQRVMKQVRALHGGRTCGGGFGRRLEGEGVLARLLTRRFDVACRKLGLGAPPPLRCDLFRPRFSKDQLELPGLDLE